MKMLIQGDRRRSYRTVHLPAPTCCSCSSACLLQGLFTSGQNWIASWSEVLQVH